MSKTRAPADGARPPAAGKTAGKTTAPAAKQARSGPQVTNAAPPPLATRARRGHAAK